MILFLISLNSNQAKNIYHPSYQQRDNNALSKTKPKYTPIFDLYL